jgi:IQ calmodulin-binding motif
MRDCSGLAAATSIQAAWRARQARARLPLTSAWLRGRAGLPLTALVLRHRAALCLQRAWRGRLFRQHLHALAAAATLVQSLSTMSLVPSLCLTLLSARMLGLARGRLGPCLPGHRLQFAFVESSGGALCPVTNLR